LKFEAVDNGSRANGVSDRLIATLGVWRMRFIISSGANIFEAKGCRDSAKAALDFVRGLVARKRPADVIGNAAEVMRMATGEETEALIEGRNKLDIDLQTA